ncbi:uncharacterized protein LOC143258678 isoform X1 [Tachypleus tridentatus]|uniref:uncharacterized protein LOC143258678 isoform X1 n=1 Tax=Tachypleus tridentatus TaxID=6853 RepID=UPI003FD18AD6
MHIPAKKYFNILVVVLKVIACGMKFQYSSIIRFQPKYLTLWLKFWDESQNQTWLPKIDIIAETSLMPSATYVDATHSIVRMLLVFRDLGCNMSIKLHFLNNHLDKFPDNLGAVSDEQGERFHQDLNVMEERWSIKRDCPDEVMVQLYSRINRAVSCLEFTTHE